MFHEAAPGVPLQGDRKPGSGDQLSLPCSPWSQASAGSGSCLTPLATAWGTDYLDKVVGGFPITLDIPISL